jgi:hypothetical protein
MTALLLAHVVSTLVLVGVIWTVQVLHYPLFVAVGADRFVSYHAEHSRRIAAIVMLPWAVEGGTTLVLLVAPPAGVARWLVLLGAALAAVPVIVTVTASVPAHHALGGGFDLAAHRRLVRSNWWRTLA